jgi:RNA polymerase sigma factor (sigma-70 family)
MSEVMQHLRKLMLEQDGAGLTDGRLLEDYLSGRDEAALAALVRRHAPMVWGVCRRVLPNHHDAEDAFQATFLVFVRKATSITSRELLANWLYGVAHQTALKARATAARRRGRERQVTKMPEAVAEQDLWHDLQPLLDQELSRLPERYRVVILLCDLESKTRKEAARELGLPEGTVASRLARARGMLARRLARHGLAVSGGALATVLAEHVASAGVPVSVVSSTIQASSLCGAGQAVKGMISPQVAALTEGVLKTMSKTRFALAFVGFLVLGALGIGAGGLIRETRAADPASGTSTNTSARPGDGNLRETVLALEKRIWEAHTRQDVEAFRNLLADDFVGTDAHKTNYTKAKMLAWVATHRVVDPVMTNARVVLLNATSAIVTYEIRYKVATPPGSSVEVVPPRYTTSAWALRDGRWWCVFSDVSVSETAVESLLGQERKVQVLDLARFRGRAVPANERFLGRSYYEPVPATYYYGRYTWQPYEAVPATYYYNRYVVQPKGDARKGTFTVSGIVDKVDGKRQTISAGVVQKIDLTVKIRSSDGRDATVEMKGVSELAVTLGKKDIRLGGPGGSKLVDVPVANDARIRDGDKVMKLTDLKPGTPVLLDLRADEKAGFVVVGIRTR